MHKLKLETLKVESFATEEDGSSKTQGTVRAHDASGAAVTCQLTCGISCVIAETCQNTCNTCYYSCLHNTCDFSCVNVNTCHC